MGQKNIEQNNAPKYGESEIYKFKHKARQTQRKLSRHIRVKILTVKDYKILKAGRGKKQITPEGNNNTNYH